MSDAKQDTLFSKIVKREIHADILFPDERVTAFRDIHPQAPTHVLNIPNQIIPTVNDITAEDEGVLGHLFVVAAKIAEQDGVAKDGYRLPANCCNYANQDAYHLHIHLFGRSPLRWSAKPT